MKSLAEYDLRIGPRVREAMSDDQKKKGDKMTSESVMVLGFGIPEARFWRCIGDSNSTRISNQQIRTNLVEPETVFGS
jgi:hypothetical protein